LPHWVREREITVRRPISSSVIASPIACRHLAISPFRRSSFPSCKRGIREQLTSSVIAGFMESIVQAFNTIANHSQ
jgi:hypothetical protein